MQLLELTAHGTQCKIHPCSAPYSCRICPVPRVLSLCQLSKPSTGWSPVFWGWCHPACSTSLVVRCRTAPSATAAPSATHSPPQPSAIPTRNPQCSVEQPGCCSLCRVRGTL